MAQTPEVLDIHAVPHPNAPVRQAGFALDHPYLEQCWAPLIGPSSTLLLRRCVWLWREAAPARVPTAELAGQLGLGKGTGTNSPLGHTLDRVVRFHFAALPAPGELHVYTEVPPVPERQLHRLPDWSRRQHDQLLGQHLDALARSSSAQAAPHVAPPPHVRMAQRLERLTNQAPTAAPVLSR